MKRKTIIALITAAVMTAFCGLTAFADGDVAGSNSTKVKSFRLRELLKVLGTPHKARSKPSSTMLYSP